MSLDLLLTIGSDRRPATGDRTFADISPVTGASMASVAAATPEDAIAAVEAAATAFESWSRTSFVERRRILLAAADLLEAEFPTHRDTFALETGSVEGWATMNVFEAAATLREAAGLASSPLGEILPSHDPRTTNFSRRGPAGVLLAIVPWNAPLILAARSIAIALALGNTVVLRPSEEAPITAGHLLADTLLRAGLPAGVINVVTSAPGEGRGLIATMIAHPAVRRVVFIGSTPVGKSIAAVAGEHLTPAVMELGGKNATIVRADADLDTWIPRLAFASFANSGQICMCSDRIIVARSIFDEVTERLAEAAAGMPVGDPRDASTAVGPLINEKAAASFSALIDDARNGGARVVTGGARDGLWATPTVLTEVGPACRYYAEEGFSPIVNVIPVDDDDAAVAAANEGDFGLIASVASRDAAAAESIAERIHAGAVHINGPSVGDEPHVPFGGLGQSGFGRLGGGDAVRFFTEQRTFYRHPVD